MMLCATQRWALLHASIAIIFFLLPTFAVGSQDGESLGCSVTDFGAVPPYPFKVGDGNDYGKRKLELTVPERCRCDGKDCTPCMLYILLSSMRCDESLALL